MSGRRPATIFRGSELPRLLFLVAIVLVGWPMIVMFSKPGAAEVPPSPSVPAAKITKIVPDRGVEFQAIQDKAPIQTRESAAYATLLERARETPAKELAAQSRRDVFFTHYWERPAAYRGVPIHLEGIAKKVLTHEIAPSMSPKGRLYEVWFYSDENRAFPQVVTIEDPPPGLVVGHELNLRVTVDAYFFKKLGYRAGDTLRAAPMFVGRMSWTPAQPVASAPMVEFRNWSRRDGFAVIVGLLVAYIAVRAFFQFRKALKPAPSRFDDRALTGGLPEDQVAEWLRDLPDEPSDAEEGPADPTGAEGLPRDGR